MPAWYMDMCVNAPLPVISPIAHTPSAARIQPSVGISWAASIQADGRHAERGQVDPAPGGDEQPLGGYRAQPRWTVNWPPSWLTRSAGASV